MRKMKSVVRIGLCALVAVGLLGPVCGARALHGEPEVWKGIIEMGGLEVDFVVRLTGGDAHGGEEPASASMDVPLQNLRGAALEDVVYAMERIAFVFAPPGAPGKAEFSLERDGDRAEGALLQFGQSFPVKMERIGEGEAGDVGPRRPQTPEAPFPYSSREVTFQNAQSGVRLQGTVTIPEGDGPFPGVVLLSGSGPQDRDSTLFGHKPFLVLADALSRRGVAVLRFDDRGVGGSAGAWNEATPSDLAWDALSAFEALGKQAEVDASRVGFIGHSEGATIGVMAAAARKEVAFVVMLAGTGLPGQDILVMQLEAISRASGMPEEAIRRQADAQRTVLAVLTGGGEEMEEDLREAIRTLVAVQMGLDPASEVARVRVSADVVEPHYQQVMSPWFRAFLETDPRTYMRKMQQPLLAVWGTLDLQVPYEVNMGEVERTLQGSRGGVTVRAFEGLNHLLQPAESGLVQEYMLIETTIDPAVLELVVEWVMETAGGGG